MYHKQIAICGLIGCLFISGCGLTQQRILQANRFGASTKAVGETTENTLLDLRKEMMQMNRQILVLDRRKNPSTFVIEKKLPSLANTLIQVSAAKALKHYGEVVVGLADPQNTTDISDAASKLAGEVQGLSDKTGQPLTEEQTGALGEIINALSGLYVKHKKAKALRRFVNAYHGIINKLAKLIAKDFNLQKRGVLRSYSLTAERLMNSCNRVLSGSKHFRLTERQLAVDGCVMAQTAQSRSRVLATQTQVAITGLQTANTELFKLINDKQYSKKDIRDYAKKTQAFINTLEVLASH